MPPGSRYDALLIVSFGGPEGPDDVIPFLENVTSGRNVPRARLDEVATRYLAVGGVSPINAANRALIAALERRFAEDGPALPIYFGNRNWHPLLETTLRRMVDDGIGRALAFVTAAYSSYSSCRQYLENIEAARARVGPDAPVVEKIRAFWNHPGFIETMAAHARQALRALPAGEDPGAVRVVYTAHSIPAEMAASCDYEAQLREAAALVNVRLPGPLAWDLAFQSRSGPPAQPWLGPDIVDHLTTLHDRGVRHVVVVPIGFVCDHMEVIYDLDTEAARAAADLGLGFARARTAGTAPSFVDAIRNLVLERTENRPPAFLGMLGPRAVPCRPGCCPPPARSTPHG
jgi:ferrochelatase